MTKLTKITVDMRTGGRGGGGAGVDWSLEVKRQGPAAIGLSKRERLCTYAIVGEQTRHPQDLGTKDRNMAGQE